MSWLGGSLSSLTGQLSNLTKDILTEGTEEVSDHVTELRVAQERLTELDTVCTSQKIEIDRLKLLIREWEEKAEGSELQINKISNEYRTLLTEKEREIKALKQKQHEQQELKSSYVDQDTHPALLELEDDGFQSVGYGRDEHDFGDNISMQRDINRLRAENHSLQTKCQHWKALAEKSSAASDGTATSSDRNDSALHKQIQELQQQLENEKDVRQQELSSLQDSHSHKMATLRRKHKEEVAQLKQRIQELDWGSEGWESQPSGSDTASPKAISKLQEEIAGLQSEREKHLQQIQELTSTVERQKSELSVQQAQSLHLESQLKMAREEIGRLQEDREKADTLEVLSDLRQVRLHLDQSAVERRNKLLVEKDKIINQIISSGEQKQELSEHVAQLESIQRDLAQETQATVENMGDTESQKITAGVVDSMERENIILREKNVSLQEQVSLLEKAMQNLNKERSAGTWVPSAGDSATIGDDLDLHSDTLSLNSDLSELSRRNLELDEEVINLKTQIRKYETDIGQFEQLQADWQSEKESLEEILLELRGQLKAKEHSLSVVQARQGLLAIEKHETSKTDGTESSLGSIAEDVVELDSKVELLAEANAQLEQERDFLLKEKNELQRELNELREKEIQVQISKETKGNKKSTTDLSKELKEKEAELQALMCEKEDLEKNLSEVSDLKAELHQKQEEVVKLTAYLENSKEESKESYEKEINDLQKKLRGKNEEIVNLSLEKQELMSSLEELDSQHEEAMSHIIAIKEQLSKSNEELKTKMKASENEIVELKEEIHKIRSQQLVNQTVESSNSNELNHQIAELKEENAELRRDVERSDAGASKLEIENAHLEKKIKELGDKCLTSAAALNDLHMDKKELTEQLQKQKGDLNSQALKLKELRIENEELKKKKPTDCAENTDEMEESNLMKTEEDYLGLQNDLEALEEKYLEEAEKARNQESVINELRQELESAKTDCENLKKESERKHEECESFSRQLHSLEAQLRDYMEMKTAKESLATQAEMLKNEVSLLKDNLGQKNDECEKLKADLKLSKDLLDDATDRLHAKCEECTELSEALEKQKSNISASESKENEYEAKLLSATGELVLVKGELESTNAELENLQKSSFENDEQLTEFRKCNKMLEKEMKDLKESVKILQQENAKAFEKVTEYKEKLKEAEAQNDLSQTEVMKLKNDMSELNEKMSAQAQNYESYVEQLKAKSESDESSIHSQYEDVLEKCHKRDLEITEMKSALADTEVKLSDSKNTVDELQTKCDTKDMELSEISNSFKKLKSDYDTLFRQLNEAKSESEKVKGRNSLLENDLKRLQELESHRTGFETERKDLSERLSALKLEFESVSNDRNALQLESSRLSQDVHVLQKRLKELETENDNYKQVNASQEASIVELNQRKADLSQTLEGTIQQLRSKDQSISQLTFSNKQKDEEISELKLKLSHAKSVVASNKAAEDGPESGKNIELIEVNEQMENVQRENKLGMVYSNKNNEFDPPKPDITAEIEQLSEKLREKDKVIAEMQRNNSSLLKMLDSKSKSSQGDSTLVEVHKLENEVRTLKVEKEQMIDVLNEKSRESSSLKAEVQRLMSVVSAEKAALQKLQQDNHELTRKSPENGEHINDMQKEVVQNLSRIIRDKDLEIESLTQKNQTLLSVLQESSSEDSHLHSLMQDKENLTKQLAVLQSEREQMIAYLNQKHQESVAYHNEVQRLTALINSENEKNDKMKHEYETLRPQFEERKQTLLKTQNELIDYKQKYTDLEVRYGQLLQQSNSEETVDKAMFESKLQELKRLQERFKELMDNVKEKEAKIQGLHQNVVELEQSLRTTESEKHSFKKQVDSFTFQVHGLQTDQSEKMSEITQLKQQKQELTIELQLMKETNNKLTLQLQDKEFQVESLQRSKSVISEQGHGDGDEKGQLETLMQENEAAQRHVKLLQHERDQTVMALHQTQEQNGQLTKEIQALKQKETKMNRELDRLRQHLIQIEDSYTKEALAAEEREKELRVRLASAEEQALTSSSAVESVNQQSSQQLDSLQQQLHFVSQQRDQAYLQLSSLQEQNQMYTVSMANLQMVLEEFQEEKEKMVAQETERLEKECTNFKAQVQKLQTDLTYTKEQLTEASDGLEAAARLSEQLDRKEEALDALREEVQIRESALKVVEEELHRLKSRSDDKVDKLVIKNLFLGYFTTPANKQREVLRAIGGVLLFTSEDFEKIEGRGRGSWVPGFLKFGASGVPATTPPTSPARRSTIGAPGTARNVDNSFSEMFVRFLERESSPPPPTVRLPAEEMVRDIQKQKETQKPAYNPFTAPRQVAAPSTSSLSSSSTTSQHLLMSSAMSMPQTIPTFAAPSESTRTPPGSGRNTPATTTSGAILKDVLSNR